MSNVDKEREALSRVLNRFPDNFFRSNFDVRQTLVKALDEFDQLREQHRPPTFDEVVKAWDIAGYEVNVKDNGAIHIYYKNTIQTSDPTFAFSMSGSDIDGMVSTKTIFFINELNAINLTIRYLESQKEKAND